MIKILLFFFFMIDSLIRIVLVIVTTKHSSTLSHGHIGGARITTIQLSVYTECKKCVQQNNMSSLSLFFTTSRGNFKK